MKKIVLALSILLSTTLHAQTCDVHENYSSSTGWTYVQDVGASNTVGTGAISFVSSQMAFQSLKAQFVDYRYYKKMPVTLCDSWVAQTEFDLTGIGGGTDQRFVGNVLSFSKNNESAFYDKDRNATDNQSLGVVFFDEASTHIWKFIVVANYNGTVSTIAEITVPTGTPSFPGIYEVKLERISGSFGELTIVNEAQEFDESVCFEIEDPIGGLRYLQHGSHSVGGPYRDISGTIDNTCVLNCYQEIDCCKFVEINGPDYNCNDELPTYNIPGWDGPVTWSVSGGVSFTGQGTEEIQITDWNDQSSVTITATIMCGCQEIILTLDVTIFNESADFTVTSGETGGSPNYYTISTPTYTYPSGVLQEWFVYEGVNCVAKTYTGAALRYSYNTTSASYNGSTSPTLLVGECYIIVHRVFDEDGYCEVISSRGIQHTLRPLGNDDGPETDTPFNIYPNPASQSLIVEVRGKDLTGFRLLVINNAGQTVIDMEGERSLNADISHLPSGIYHYQLIQANKTVQNGMLQKN